MIRRPVAGGGCFTWNLAATEWNKPQIVRSEFSLWTSRWPINCLHLTVLISFRDTKRQLKQDLRLQKKSKNLKSLVTCLYLSGGLPAYIKTNILHHNSNGGGGALLQRAKVYARWHELEALHNGTCLTLPPHLLLRLQELQQRTQTKKS